MDLHQTDPEFAERFAYFAFQEVINEENQQLDEKTRYMAISAALIGCGACGKYEGGPFYFNEAAGTLRCADCAAKEGKAPNLDGAALTALRHIALVEDKKIFSFSIPPESMEALGRAAEHYAAHHLDKPLKTLDFLKTVLL